MKRNLLLTLCLCMASLFGATAQTTSLTRIPVKKVSQSRALLNAKATTVYSWKESFEDWDEQDMFWLPEGWTAQRTPSFMSTEDPHTWAVARQLNIFYPQPVDGKYYATCYYNDDAPQDEWLYSPELTPREGEYLTYFVTLQPFFLFDIQYFDEASGTLSQTISTADLKLYISVEGGEWQQVNSMFDTYRQEDIAELYELAHNGYVSNRKMFVDMSPYAGKAIRLAFRYHGQGGDSMYIDDLELTTLSLTAGYQLPAGSMYLGMTPEFMQPAGYLYMPDNTELIWNNTSSFEALSFDWAYASTSNYSQTAHSTTSNLVTNYNTYVPRAEQTTGEENIAVLPTLNVDGVGGLHDSYTHPAGKMLIGGKAEFAADGVTHKTGASFCSPSKGYDIMTTDSGTPYFGVGEGNKALWTKLFGVEAEVTGVGMYVKEPAKPWQMRGLHIQGVGEITKAYKLSVNVRKFNVYGSVDDEPIATAIIDVDNITEQDDPSGMKLYNLPFLFPDVVTIDRDVIITLDGLPKAATWFAPLQTAQYEDNVDDSHAIFEYEYVDGGEKFSGMNYVSNLGTQDDEGNVQACATNFYFNFDIAYGDCDDWGHLDIDIPGPEMPDLTCADNTIKLVDAETMESLYGEEMPYKPLVCGFYDESDADQLTLYVCIGELYEYEGGPFYSDKVNDTYYIKVSLPKALADGEEHAVNASDVTVDYYDLMSHSWLLNATQGTLSVKETAPHVYSVDVKALDPRTSVALAARYVRPEEWRFRDFTEVRPDPSVFDLTSGGRVVEHHDILSCVVDQSNPDLPVFYLADEAGITTVADVEALDAKKYVSIACPTSLMDGLMKGFSGWANDDLTVTYMGLDYNHSNCQHDETCFGGNVAVLEYDTDNNHVIINSKIFTMTQYNKYNMTIHYDGPFSVDNHVAGIHDVNESSAQTGNAYNLQGQLVNATAKGIIIHGGRKILVK